VKLIGFSLTVVGFSNHQVIDLRFKDKSKDVLTKQWSGKVEGLSCRLSKHEGLSYNLCQNTRNGE
jgi:hypothetical protein